MEADDDRLQQARQRMVTTIRRRGVTDEHVLGALTAVDRARFVPGEPTVEAYADRPLAIGHEATISQPYIVARMLELAELSPGDRVLDVGTGSGYAAALAARVAARVVGVERVEELTERARSTLADVGAHDVEVHTGDGHDGWPDAAPYDAILVAAAAAEVPTALTDQLADGGRLVIPVGEEHATQHLLRVRRSGDDLHHERMTAVRFVPLVEGG